MPIEVAVGRPGTGTDGRRAILEAAAASFMEYGFSGATIDDVADRIGATKGRVYHYYRSKIDLFLDVHLMAMAIMAEAVRPVAAAGGPPGARLRAMAKAHALAIMDHFPFQKVSIQGLERPLISGRSARPDAAIERVVALRKDYEAMFVAVIEEGLSDGSFAGGPPRLMSKALLGSLNWLTLWYRPELDPEPGGRARIAETLADYAVRGLAAR